MCFKIKFCKNAIHDDITRRGGGEEGREGGGAAILVLKLSFKLFIAGKYVSNNAILTDNASYKLEANRWIFDSKE